jgi:hypothetical protein
MMMTEGVVGVVAVAVVAAADVAADLGVGS